jgi:hypothetical protein
MVERRSVYRVLLGNPKGKKPLGGSSLNGTIILRRIFRKWNVEV